MQRVVEVSEGERVGRARPRLRTLAILIYATLLLLLFAMPEEVASRLDDLPSWPIVRAAQAGVGAITNLSNAIGVAPLYRAARNRFLDATGLSQT